MLTDLKLKNKMLLGYSVPVLLVAGLATVVYSNAVKISQTFKQVEATQSTLKYANQMILIHARMVEAARGYLLFNNEELVTHYEAANIQFMEAARRAAQTSEDRGQKQRVEEMVRLKQKYNEFSQRLINLSREGKNAEALALFRTEEGKNAIEQFRSLSAAFNEAEEKILTASTNEANVAISNLIAAVVLGTLLCLVFSAVAAYGISSSIAGTIDRAIDAIASSSTEIAATLEQQERTASTQANAVNQTTTTMDELRASSRQSASQAEASAVGAKQALRLAETGTKAVGSSLEAQALLKEKVSAIAQQILQLSEQTNQIGNISRLVSDLANKTNMLALNAAVEAVRAGEYGKGFGVVASEIRKLADRSQKSAQKIDTLVGDIQTAINSTVLVTDEGTKTVDRGVEIAKETAEALSGVRKAIDEVVMSSQQIALNAQQQVSAIEQVVEAMHSLSIGAKETVAGISNTRIGTQQLHDAARDLKAIIDRE